MRSASSARHGVGVITVVTALAISSQARVMYATWANGNGDSRRSPGWLSTSVPRATAARLAWSNDARPWAVPWCRWSRPRRRGRATPRSGQLGGGLPVPSVADLGPPGHRHGRELREGRGVGVDHEEHRGRPLHDGRHLSRPQAWIDARRDGTEAGQRGVEHRVLDGGGQHQADDVALGDTAAGQVAGDAVGGPVPRGEGRAHGAPAGPSSTYASTSPLTRAASRRTDTMVSCRSKGMRAGMAGGDGTRGGRPPRRSSAPMLTACWWPCAAASGPPGCSPDWSASSHRGTSPRSSTSATTWSSTACTSAPTSTRSPTRWPEWTTRRPGGVWPARAGPSWTSWPASAARTGSAWVIATWPPTSSAPDCCGPASP